MEHQRITLRIPLDLHEELMRISEEKSLSMNAEIVTRLRSSLKSQQSDEALADQMRRIAQEVVREELKASQ